MLLLDDGPVELVGTVATVAPAARGEGYLVGFDFDELDAPLVDAIVAWCFRYPFGPEHTVAPVPAAPAVHEEAERDHEEEYARQSRLLAAAESSAASSEAAEEPDDPEVADRDS